MMKRPKNNFFDESLKAGLVAETAAKKECKDLGLKFKPSTLTDQEYGIDFYLGENEIPVDIKNTFDIYLGNGFGDDKFMVRQPFRKNCKAREYWLMDKYTNKWFYKGSISDYLSENYFTNHITLTFAKKYLQQIEDSKQECNAILFGEIKNKLVSLTQDTVHISYEFNEEANYWTIKMKTYNHNKYELKMGNKPYY